VYGNGPDAAKFVKLRAVITIPGVSAVSPMSDQKTNKKLTIEDNHFMSRVDIEALTEGERDRVVDECRVGGRVMHSDGGVRQTRDHLLQPTDALHARDRRAKGRAVPELQV
jgi:hypothetical protein